MSDDIKKGLLGIVVDETTISQVMPDINSLTYRGYAVQDLCEKCTFEEVAYLILNKELPNKAKLKKFKNKSFVVAVSGGPDSLALVALSQAYSLEKKIKFHYVLINHNIRKNSSSEAEKVKNLGFTGKAAIHPSQIDFINDAFEPTKEEKEEAKKVLEEYQKMDGGAVKIDGKMVDEPIAEAMRLKLSLGDKEGED